MADKKATKKVSCKHEHECEKCIREEIAALEKKVKELKAKLPAPTIHICAHGCHGYCSHYYNNLLTQNQQKVPYVYSSTSGGLLSISTTSGTNAITFRTVNDNKLDNNT